MYIWSTWKVHLISLYNSYRILKYMWLKLSTINVVAKSFFKYYVPTCLKPDKHNWPVYWFIRYPWLRHTVIFHHMEELYAYSTHYLTPALNFNKTKQFRRTWENAFRTIQKCICSEYRTFYEFVQLYLIGCK